MKRFISYGSKVPVSEMPLCATLSLTRIRSQIVLTTNGELYVSDGYLIGEGEDKYLICTGSNWIKEYPYPDGVTYTKKIPEYHRDCVKDMLALNVGYNKTVRVRTRGLNARSLYTTRLRTFVNPHGELTNGFH